MNVMFELLIYDKSKTHFQMLRQGNFLILYKGTSIDEHKWNISEHNDINSWYWIKLDHYV